MIVDSPIQRVFDKLGYASPRIPGFRRLTTNIQKTNECPLRIDGWKMKSHYLFRWHDTFQGKSSISFQRSLLKIDSGLQYRHRESVICFGSIPKKRLIGIPVTKKTAGDDCIPWARGGLPPRPCDGFCKEALKTPLVHRAMQSRLHHFAVADPLLSFTAAFQTCVITGPPHYLSCAEILAALFPFLYFRRIGSGLPAVKRTGKKKMCLSTCIFCR